MGAWLDAGAEFKGRRPSSNYRVRFRHSVYPNAEGQATRADIRKYDYFFSTITIVLFRGNKTVKNLEKRQG
jgi:hypothetical protein